MTNSLEQLKQHTTIVADTGDIEAIKKFQPEDATTNPSLILKAAQLPQYKHLIEQAVANAKNSVEDACDELAVNIGLEILKIIPGRISTEVDARLSFDTQASISKAKKILALYEKAGVSKDRVLIKLASTWEGIKAAEQLEKEGISCNLTLLFNFAQAQACAEANVYLISPFVGRILDWYKKNTNETYSAETDPGVVSVSEIYAYYKQHDYQTIVMGASFRNIGEIIELSGCDRLTIGPALLDELQNQQQDVTRKLTPAETSSTQPEALTEAQFRWQMNQDTMATEKLAEGIRNFAIDQVKLEDMLSKFTHQ
jgi:transaldolase